MYLFFSIQTSFSLHLFLNTKTFCIEIKQVNNIVIVSGEQRKDPATHIHVPNVPQAPLLCYTN